MKHNLNHLLVLVAFLTSIVSCEIHDEDEITAKPGTADFSNYVAIGNSLTAGFTNGDVTVDGQWLSFPHQLSLQFAEAGGGLFRQPLMFDNAGFGKRIIFEFDTRKILLAGDIPKLANFDNIGADGPYNNMGVTGTKIVDVMNPAYSDSAVGSKYYARFAKEPAVSTIMEEAMAQKPTFVTFWIGTNDALGYALRGGDLTEEPEQAITEPSVFREKYQAAMDALGDTPSMIANVVPIDVIPYFSMGDAMDEFLTINLYTGITLTTEQAKAANEAIAKAEKELLDQGITHSYGVSYTAGSGNQVIVEDPSSSLPEGFRFRKVELTDDFLLTLLADYPSFSDEITVNGLGTVGTDGVLRPIKNKHVLNQTEKNKVSEAIAEYNIIIADIVSKKNNLHLVDMHSYMSQLKAGFIEDGISFSTEYITGAFFSYDGVHPNGTGYTVVANKFIKEINTVFGSTINRIDLRTTKK